MKWKLFYSIEAIILQTMRTEFLHCQPLLYLESIYNFTVEHQQLLLEASREEANLPVAEATDISQASTSASQKTLESKKINATKSLISSATFQSLPNSMSKPLECESSTFITGSSLERKSNAFIKPVPEITI